MKELLSVVVVGDVNSGKSTLIGRFLYEMGSLSDGSINEIESTCRRLNRAFEFAYLLDSLEEEREGEFTLDTTQVFCKERNGNGFFFIDVPGHRELFKNMLCGSSYADIAIVVIDIGKFSGEGVKRHIKVLNFLGVDKVIIVFNKMDLVNFNKKAFLMAKDRVKEYFTEFNLKLKYVVPISASGGENLCKKPDCLFWHNGLTLYGAIKKLRKRRENKKQSDLYFPIQDTYPIGEDKVFVGTLFNGSLKSKDAVEALPTGEHFTVKKIRIFDKFKSKAKAGGPIGIVFDRPETLGRGQIICKKNTFRVTNKFQAKIFCVSPVNINDVIEFRCATQVSVARITQIKRILSSHAAGGSLRISALGKADIAQVEIVTESRVSVAKNKQMDALSKFILKNKTGICAAGVIV